MRSTEKVVCFLIVALCVWAISMQVATNLQFQGSQSNRIMLVELGSDAAALNLAVQANGPRDFDGIAHNIRMVVRNTDMDFVFIPLYWLTYLSLAYLAGILGNRALAAAAAFSIVIAAVFDVLENGAILTAMGVKPFTDAVAVDIWEYSQTKWAFFFVSTLLLGLAMALNRRVSGFRRNCGWVFTAAGVFGIVGLILNSVNLSMAFRLMNFGMLLVKELNHIDAAHHAHAHA